MSKDTKENKEPDQYDHLMTVSNSVARSCVAVVDAMLSLIHI